MLISPINISHYLLNEGLIDTGQLVLNEFTIHEHHSRNKNFIINKYGGCPYFVKQIKTHEAEKIHTLKREATCYWLAQNHPSFTSWNSVMPEYKSFDQHNHILTTTYYPSSCLHYHLKKDPNTKAEITGQFAELLYQVHNEELPSILKNDYGQYFPGELPFVFKMAGEKFSAWWRQNESYKKELFSLIKSDPVYIEKMNEVVDLWEPATVIHADLKFQNVLIEFNGSLRIIDWETCDIGDPSWDLAAVFHMYLVGWMNSELLNGHSSQSEQNSPLLFDQDYMQDQLHIFWVTYNNMQGWDKELSDKMLKKVLLFSALKLVHTSFEITTQTKKVDDYVVQILQLGLNILKNPQRLAKELLNFNS